MHEIKIERQPPIATVTLNRPDKRNAISSAMWQALPSVAASIQTDTAIRVALIRGAGHEAFSAGADIAEMRANAADAAAMRVMQDAGQNLANQQ
jgi:enoyl-CoA hydratase/carnithine racemase